MKLADLTEFLVKSLVKDPDAVSVKAFDDDDLITIEVIVDSDDMGRVIGKKGIIASAIRTIVQASSYLNHDKRVHINIASLWCFF